MNKILKNIYKEEKKKKKKKKTYLQQHEEDSYSVTEQRDEISGMSCRDSVIL